MARSGLRFSRGTRAGLALALGAVLALAVGAEAGRTQGAPGRVNAWTTPHC